MRDREGDEEGKRQDAGTPGGAQGGRAGEVAAGNGPGTQDGADEHEGTRARNPSRHPGHHRMVVPPLRAKSCRAKHTRARPRGRPSSVLARVAFVTTFPDSVIERTPFPGACHGPWKATSRW